MQLIFVYNANSDMFSVVKDYWHKLLLPSTYPCNLCALTWGAVSMKSEWRQFINKLDTEVVFMHKNEFIRQYGLDTKFPAAFMKIGEQLTDFIDAGEMDKLKSLEELKNLISEKMITNDKGLS